MGLLDRIFGNGNGSGNGNGRERDPAAAPLTSQFCEGDPDDDDSQPSRNAPRRELVQVILRDTMRKHGIPSDWIDCRILSTVSSQGRPGLHVNFVVRQAHDRLLAYVFAFQDSFERELARFEPRSGDWLLSLAWEFQGFDVSTMEDPKTWAHSNFSPSSPAPLIPAAADAPRQDDDVQSDLQKLFAIRDAALAQTTRAAAAADEDDHPEFQPTQPFDDGGAPKR